ncbi:hypothetical protein HYC85_003478 [Camellia sinensis]|uniref:C-JID domain-containing protein n=1 Tax=Camellia sinensis TaxID=4442 RepID=A0A7J7HTU1_CAMSI|nr:hypothetical protein HYC85_003478 [Camellia sinensis]
MSKYENVEGFSFMNCFKRAKNEQNNILSKKFLSNQFQRYFEWQWQYTTYIRFPESEIPKWFSHQSRGCSLSFELPPHCYNDSFLGIVFAVVGIKNESKCYSIEVGFKGPSSMEDDTRPLNEDGIEFQACLVREGHDFDVYNKEADEEAWRIIDSSNTEDNNMSVFHGDLDRSVGRAGVEVASFSATTSKRRRGDLNDNHYNAAVGSSGCGKFDDQEEEDNLNRKRPKQAGPSECGNFD